MEEWEKKWTLGVLLWTEMGKTQGRETCFKSVAFEVGLSLGSPRNWPWKKDSFVSSVFGRWLWKIVGQLWKQARERMAPIQGCGGSSCVCGALVLLGPWEEAKSMHQNPPPQREGAGYLLTNSQRRLYSWLPCDARGRESPEAEKKVLSSLEEALVFCVCEWEGKCQEDACGTLTAVKRDPSRCWEGSAWGEANTYHTEYKHEVPMRSQARDSDLGT